MAFVRFPSTLTKEEEMLKLKFEELRFLKQAVQEFQTRKQETSNSHVAGGTKHDAKEVATKLLKSGAISALKVENKGSQVFKRAKTGAKKRKSTVSSPSASVPKYKPITSNSVVIPKPAPKPGFHKIWNENFAYSRSINYQERNFNQNHHQRRFERPIFATPEQQGTTLFVGGAGITKEIIEHTFQPLGNISNITMVMKKNCGFVTFRNYHEAKNAKFTINGTATDGVHLYVDFAKKQTFFKPAASNIVKEEKKSSESADQNTDVPNRDAISYDDILIS